MSKLPPKRAGYAIHHALVVCGAEGLGGISCAGSTCAWDTPEGEAVIIRPTSRGRRSGSQHTRSQVSRAARRRTTWRCCSRRSADDEAKEVEVEVEVVPSRLAPVLDFVLMNAAPHLLSS